MQVGQKRKKSIEEFSLRHKRRVKDQVRELVANFFHLSEGQEVDAYLNLGLGRSSDIVEEEPSQDFTALLQAFEDSNLKEGMQSLKKRRTHYTEEEKSQMSDFFLDFQEKNESSGLTKWQLAAIFLFFLHRTRKDYFSVST